uniref:Uncharacterized protein n=1 Tax=Oryza sativa subsp. japonica TaxID=39947 RepID=Q6ZEZ9_ORYSJ|nr:hypothetical protein [Oryza sativa Japonica Group]
MLPTMQQDLVGPTLQRPSQLAARFPRAPSLPSILTAVTAPAAPPMRAPPHRNLPNHVAPHHRKADTWRAGSDQIAPAQQGVAILSCNACAVSATDMWARNRWDPHVSETYCRCSTAVDLHPQASGRQKRDATREG